MVLPKIITALLLFSSLGESKPKKRKGKAWLKLSSQGHKIALCIDGDECNRLMQMKLSRLYEVDVNGTDVGNAAKNFNNPKFVSYNYNWSVPEDILLGDGSTDVIGSRVQLDTDLLVGKPKDGKYATFSLITDIFHNDTEVIYGNETINVVADSMKFSLLVGNWPWADENNGLSFGVKLKAKTRTEQLELGDGMFIDSPLNAIIDDEIFGDVTTTVEAATDTDDDGISIHWILPHFSSSIYYDPIMAEGQEQLQQQEEEDESDHQQQQNDDDIGPVEEIEGNSGNSLSAIYSLCTLLIFSALLSYG